MFFIIIYTGLSFSIKLLLLYLVYWLKVRGSICMSFAFAAYYRCKYCCSSWSYPSYWKPCKRTKKSFFGKLTFHFTCFACAYFLPWDHMIPLASYVGLLSFMENMISVEFIFLVHMLNGDAQFHCISNYIEQHYNCIVWYFWFLSCTKRV